MHPTLKDISDLTDSELEQKILKLNGMYFMTSNDEVRQQMILLIDTYKIELEARRAHAKLQAEQDADNPLDDLINVS